MAKKTDPKKTDPKRHVIETAMALAAERGWRRLTLGEIAEGAGLTLAELRTHVSSKPAILLALNDLVDEIMLAAGPGDGDSARERLFEVVMRRFEALQPFKDGIASALRDGPGDPLAALCGGLCLLRSMAWTLEAAGIGSAGLIGLTRTKVLAGMYLSTIPVWLRDDSADLGRTMAALDRRLARAESMASFCAGRGRRRRGGDGAAAEAPAG
ncbi:MAG: TetR family transcriptional regulator [Candidatus Eiseniibacteriota bacterium]